jgi:hypothetical protein
MLPAGSQLTSMLEKAILVLLKALLFEMDSQSNSLLWESGTQFGLLWNTTLKTEVKKFQSAVPIHALSC